jgi:hypothetical protein
VIDEHVSLGVDVDVTRRATAVLLVQKRVHEIVERRRV